MVSLKPLNDGTLIEFGIVASPTAMARLLYFTVTVWNSRKRFMYEETQEETTRGI
jgi:hypothetical protein